MTIVCVRENDDEVIEACPYCHVAGATLNIFRDDRVFYSACANCGACGGRCTSAQNALDSWNRVARAVITEQDEAKAEAMVAKAISEYKATKEAEA